jgi:hypothetical protein
LEHLGVTPRTARLSNCDAAGPASSNDVQLSIALPKDAQTSLILFALAAIGNGFGCVLARRNQHDLRQNVASKICNVSL